MPFLIARIFLLLLYTNMNKEELQNSCVFWLYFIDDSSLYNNVVVVTALCAGGMSNNELGGLAVTNEI